VLTVRLCGGLQLELDGAPLALPRSRRSRSLLAWLALHPGRHARGRLAGLFWPDVLDTSARTSLRSALTELRTALGGAAGCLTATREAVALESDQLWIDVRAFAERLDAGDDAGALSACRGELLMGFDDDWVHAARAEHAAQAGAALARLGQRAAAEGDRAAALAWAREAAALDPLAEDAHRRLMEQLEAGGETAAALSVYEQLAERLRTTLGIAPSPPTRALAVRLRAGSAGAATVLTIPAPPEVSRAGDEPFVGRTLELMRLAGLLAGVADRGGRRLALLSGEPGIGKTRLALRFAAEPGRAATVLLGRCAEESLSPYGPFAEILARCDGALGAAVVDDLVGDGAAELERLRGHADGAATDPGVRARVFHALDTLVGALAQPVLLVLDDLQWADQGTLLALRALLRSPRPARLLIVATARTASGAAGDDARRALADLRRDGTAEELGLGGLAPPDVSALARAWLGEQATAALATEVHARSGGNALFAQELLRGDALASTTGIPESARDVIRARCARVGEGARALLAVAATIGEQVELAVLEQASSLDPRSSEDALDELVAARLLAPGASGEPHVEFPHALVREVVYADVGPLGRVRLHRDVARALLSRDSDRHVEAIAHHLMRSGDPAAAIPYLERAADNAMAMAAYEQAARCRAQAVQALDAAHADSDPRRGTLLAAAGEALLHAGDPAAARLRFGQARAIARRTRDARLLARAALGHGGLAVEIMDVDSETVGLLEEALNAVGATDPGAASALLARLAVELYYSPSRDRTDALSAEAVRSARRTGDPRAIAVALNARHVGLWRPDRLSERRVIADEMIAFAQAASDPMLALQARNWRVVDLFEAGEMSEWRLEVARHGSLAEELRVPAYTWYSTLWAAVDALHRGDFEQAAALRERARALGGQAGDRNAELFAEMLRFEEQAMHGDFAGVELPWVEDRIATSASGASYQPAYAWILASLGREEEARAQLSAVAAGGFAALPFDANWLSALAEAGEAALLLGDRDTASHILTALTPYAGRQTAAGRAVVTHGCVDRQLGHAAAVLGRREEAIAHYESAIRIDEAAGFRPWAERARRSQEAMRAR
jgi:DNA-binding SARP family transcriptional activator